MVGLATATELDGWIDRVVETFAEMITEGDEDDDFELVVPAYIFRKHSCSDIDIAVSWIGELLEDAGAGSGWEAMYDNEEQVVRVWRP